MCDDLVPKKKRRNMQTFLPCADFRASARFLDRQRLGKQRVEAWQILQALHRTTGGWRNHPAVRMWRGYDAALALYGIAMCREWRRRGYRDTLRVRFKPYVATDPLVCLPAWLGDEAFHRSHRSNLLRKAPDHYRPFWPTEADDLPYVWPV